MERRYFLDDFKSYLKNMFDEWMEDFKKQTDEYFKKPFLNIEYLINKEIREKGIDETLMKTIIELFIHNLNYFSEKLTEIEKKRVIYTYQDAPRCYNELRTYFDKKWENIDSRLQYVESFPNTYQKMLELVDLNDQKKEFDKKIKELINLKEGIKQSQLYLENEIEKLFSELKEMKK